MKSRAKLKTLCLLICLSFPIGSFAIAQPVAGPTIIELKISFADPLWDGVKIPDGQQCNRFGGKASTPSLVVENLPANANVLILEFSDKSFKRMDNGGHGKIAYRIRPESKKVTIPQVPGHTFSLPPGFFLVKAHQSPKWDTAGAYMPPCSGGKGNIYDVVVKAINNNPKGEGFRILGKGRLILGKY